MAFLDLQLAGNSITVCLSLYMYILLILFLWRTLIDTDSGADNGPSTFRVAQQ